MMVSVLDKFVGWSPGDTSLGADLEISALRKIALEQTQGISVKDKTSKYTAPEVIGVKDRITSPILVSARVARLRIYALPTSG
ncbi:hypothetical protein KI688_006639 [Linnemannia hyalina]|uniref:Uncharacterized protein n=1 Tax=Linnemannia hyalina TaxID=64524 RepID=A0A9P7XJ93_9FUNG|nr:hypothetical protein KI688_006639 [Linnemannia hyalina]